MRAGAAVVALLLAGVVGAHAASSGRGPTSGANVLKVDATGVACPDARFTRIQDALDAAKNNMVIVVCRGEYAEQLIVSKKVRIVGVGRPVIKPTAMVANTTSLRTGGAIAAAVVVTAPAVLDGLEFDLGDNGIAGCGPADPSLIGVYFRGASGGLRSSRIHGVALGEAARTCDTGAAVLVQGTGQKSNRVDLSRNVISGYQRAGIVVNEPGARANIRGNTVTGAGATSDVVQNGIQVGFGAVAVVTGNTVQNNAGPSAGPCTFDGGNLVFRANGGTITRNTFTGNTGGLIVTGNRNRILRNTVDGFSGGAPAGLTGISVFGDANVMVSNTVRNVSQAGIRVAGNGNLTIRNVVNDTHEDVLCEAARAIPGCADVLAVCGVGIWISDGSNNGVTRNILSGNDVALRNDGLRTVIRGRAGH